MLTKSGDNNSTTEFISLVLSFLLGCHNITETHDPLVQTAADRLCNAQNYGDGRCMFRALVRLIQKPCGP